MQTEELRRLLEEVADRAAMPALELPSLDSASVVDLFTDRVPAIYVDNFFDAERAADLASYLCSNAERAEVWRVGGGVLAANGIATATSRLGIPLNEALAPGANLTDTYFRETNAIADAIRRGAKPSPFDDLLKELTRHWPGGLRRRVFTTHVPETARESGPAFTARLKELERYEGSELCPVVGRYTLDAVPVHCDYAGPSFTNGYAASVISANLFCAVPKSGGAFRVWPHHDYQLLSRLGKDLVSAMLQVDGLLREDESAWSIKPTPGSLLLINTRFLHAVDSFDTTEPRLALQTFFSRKENGALEVWT